jgi:glycosidase
MIMTDNIFGDLLDPGKRVTDHLQALDGVHHRHIRIPLDPIPGQTIELILITSGTKPYDRARCLYTTDGSDPDGKTANILELATSALHWDNPSWNIVRTWSACVPAQPAKTIIRYKMAAHQADTDEWISSDFGTTFSIWVDDDPPPAWAKDALIYQIFPDRFYPGNEKEWNSTNSLRDIHGGTLQGIIDKLEYIKNLGFNAIWMTPFFKTTSHHGYNASDYYTVEPRLGSNETLKNLVEIAHSHGIHLVLDFVANHWSSDHFTFVDARTNEASLYHDWYTWKSWPDEYECYFNVKDLPKINLNNADARYYMLEIARYWLKFGFDGYRLDFAYGPSHDFWIDFRRACREVGPDSWLIGEVIHTEDRLRSYTGILDGTLDFHLARAIRETFALGRMSLAAFEAFLINHEAYFPADHIRPSFLDNHDETRFLYLAGNDKAKLRIAALVHYTLIGPPIVFAGTETGVTQTRPMNQNGHSVFEECRIPMNWDSADTDMQDYYRRLNYLRQTNPVLRSGIRQVVLLDSPNGIYVYSRGDTPFQIYVALNIGTEPRTITVTHPGWNSARDALNGHRISILPEKMEITLPPKSGSLIIPQY